MKNKTISAYDSGYRITSSGDVIGKNGDVVRKRKNTNGYYVFSFRFFGVATSLPYHRLQAYQKFGEKMFESGIVVRHLNGEKTDNSWDNIAIGTASDNMQDIPQHIRLASAIYASSFVKKHDKEKIKQFYNNCKSYSKTMKEFNISSKGTLHYILKTS